MIKVNIDEKQAGSWIQAALLISGMVLFSYGAYIMWRPLGFMLPGFLLFGTGLMLNKVMENKK